MDHTETGLDMQFAILATRGVDERSEESFVWIFLRVQTWSRPAVRSKGRGMSG